MKYIYKITGKVSLLFYIFNLYQLWHLCQYGGLRRHIPMLVLGIIGLGEYDAAGGEYQNYRKMD